MPGDDVADLFGLDDGGQDVPQRSVPDDRHSHRKQEGSVGAFGEAPDGGRACTDDAIEALALGDRRELAAGAESRIDEPGSRGIGERHPSPLGLRSEHTPRPLPERRQVVAVEGKGGRERFEDRDGAAQLAVDGRGDRPGELEPDALGLNAVLLSEEVETDAGHEGERHDAGAGEQQKSPAEWGARPAQRAQPFPIS